MKKTNTKKTKINSNFIFFSINILILLLAFFLNKGGILRIFLWLASCIVLIGNIYRLYKSKPFTNIMIFGGIFILSLIIDGVISISLKKIPLFAYNITNVGDSRVYNAIGFRVWQCDKTNFNDLKVDPFYNKGFVCKADSIPSVEINSFLNSVIENYSDYKNSYIKVTGKISKKTGQNYIEMQPYESNSVTINGYVNFANNITLRILFNENAQELDNYDVYDEITVVGIIKNLDELNNSYIIYMNDSKVVSSIDLNEYKISITEEKECSSSPSIIYFNEISNVYTYCIEDMVVVSTPDAVMVCPKSKTQDVKKIVDKLTLDGKEEWL